jgi:DNA-binding transcriptional ArsR family regulator
MTAPIVSGWTISPVGFAPTGKRGLSWRALKGDIGRSLTRFDIWLTVESMSAVFKALADPTRRGVLQLLRSRPMTAGELADNFVVSKSTMSAHFAILREADLVDVEKVGKTLVYRLKVTVLEDAMLAFVDAMQLGLRPTPRKVGKRRLQGKSP